MIVAPEDPLPIQFQKEIDMMHQNGLMSNNTSFISKFYNTHAPVEIIKERFEQVVNYQVS